MVLQTSSRSSRALRRASREERLSKNGQHRIGAKEAFSQQKSTSYSPYICIRTLITFSEGCGALKRSSVRRKQGEEGRADERYRKRQEVRRELPRSIIEISNKARGAMNLRQR